MQFADHRDIYAPDPDAIRDLRWYFLFDALWLFGRPILIALFAIGMILGAAQFSKADDLALGDSIALGTGSALQVHTVARQNMGSCWILEQAPTGSFEHVVISAGINDAPGNCVEAIRKKYAGSKVVWILPAPINSARGHVASVALQYNDRTVSYRCRGACNSSNFHPRSYPALAAAVRHAWGEEFGNSKRGRVEADTPTSEDASTSTIGGRGGLIYAPAPPPDAPAVAPRVLPTTAAPAESIWQKVHDFFLPPRVSSIIEEEAAKEGVPVELAKRIAKVESHGDCHVSSSAGALGVMQVKPATARAMGVHGSLYDCRNSVVAGVRYLKLALAKSGGNWAHAAALYNGGLGATRRVTHYSRLVLAMK